MRAKHSRLNPCGGVRAAALALVLAVASLSATAQSYPAKPVRMIVPAAPGGVTDTLARLFGQRLTELWAQPLIVENR